MFKKCLVLSFLLCVLHEAKSAAAAVDLEDMSARITEIDGEIKEAMREIEPIKRIGEDIKVGKEGKLPSSALQKYEKTLTEVYEKIVSYKEELSQIKFRLEILPADRSVLLLSMIESIQAKQRKHIDTVAELKRQVQDKKKEAQAIEAEEARFKRDAETLARVSASRAAAGGAGAGAGAALDAEGGGARASSRSRSPSRRAARSGGGSGASAAPGASADMIAMLGGSAVPTPSTVPLARGGSTSAKPAHGASPALLAMLGGGAAPAPSAIEFAQVYIEPSYEPSSGKTILSSLKITFNPRQKDEFIRMLTDNLLISRDPKYKDMFEESLRYEHDTREFKALQDRWLEESKHKSFATGYDSTERNIEFIIKAAQAIKIGMNEITLPLEVIIHKKHTDFEGKRGVYALNSMAEVGDKIS